VTGGGSHVWVVIPSYSDPDALLACIASVTASRGPAPNVLVVDDASPDDTVAQVRRRFPQCAVVANAENVGFATTCNRGFARALDEGAEHVLLLNQDTVVSPDLVATLAAFLARHPDAGIVGPRTWLSRRADDGRERLLYAGAWRTALPLRQRIPGIEQVDTQPVRSPRQVDYVWGHGMMMRAQVLRQVGSLDTDFRMYYEDLDLCRRARAAGFEIWCEPSATMWHDITDGARAHRSDSWRWVCKVAGASVFHRKHYGWPTAPLLSLLTVADEARQLLWSGHLRATGHLLTAALRHALGGRAAPTRRAPAPAGGDA
jgi:GT2 family glycosyltransferase